MLDIRDNRIFEYSRWAVIRGNRIIEYSKSPNIRKNRIFIEKKSNNIRILERRNYMNKTVFSAKKRTTRHYSDDHCLLMNELM